MSRRKNYIRKSIESDDYYHIPLKEFVSQPIVILSYIGFIMFVIWLSIIIYEYSDKYNEKDDFVVATLVEVVDGDTIKVKTNGNVLKVRLIGVNCPESVHADAEQNSEYGTMASDFTKDFLKDYTTVYLQYDEARQDQYGRELCYVWLEDNIDIHSKDDISTYMFNSILLEEGYAADAAYEPNTSYAGYFEDVCQDARAEQVGLWQYDDFVLE